MPDLREKVKSLIEAKAVVGIVAYHKIYAVKNADELTDAILEALEVGKDEQVLVPRSYLIEAADTLDEWGKERGGICNRPLVAELIRKLAQALPGPPEVKS